MSISKKNIGGHNVTGDASEKMTHREMAEMMGICLTTLKYSQRFFDALLEFQQMHENKNLSFSTVSRVIARLSKDEQRELLARIDTNKRYTQKEIEALINTMSCEQNEKFMNDFVVSEHEVANAVRIVRKEQTDDICMFMVEMDRYIEKAEAFCKDESIELLKSDSAVYRLFTQRLEKIEALSKQIKKKANRLYT